MLSLYEILKTSKTGIAPDLWTRLAAEKMAGDSEKVRELTGELPLTFTANGKPLLDYTIYGNMEQAGTPTPTAPIQPSECGDRTKNLFDKDNAVITHLYPLQDGTTFIQGSEKMWSIILPCKPNTTYTLSKSILSHSTPRHRVSGSEEYPTAGGAQTFIDDNSETISGDTRTRQIFTTTENTHWIVCFLYSNNSYESLIDQLQSLQLEEGNDKTVYEPYGYKIPINTQGKNLFDKDNVVFSGFYPHADTGVVVNTSSGKFISIIVPCEPNTSYIWSFDKTVADLRNRVAGYSAYPTVGMACTFLDIETDSPSGSTRTVQKFTTTANTHWLILMVTGTGQTAEMLTEDVAENAQLEIGSEMTSYDPYVQPTISNIYLGEVQTTRKIKKLVLTGYENFVAGSVIGQIRTSLTGAIDTLGYCTHYILKAIYDKVFPYFRIKGNTLWFEISPNGYETKEEAVADFKSYLQQQYSNGTPVTVWYVLATPQTAFVNEPLRKIGNYADTVSYEQAGVQIPTNRGNTVIDVLTTLKPSEMYIKYQE